MRKTHDLHAFATQITARFVALARGEQKRERERACVRESVLYRRRSPRVCRDVELAGVFWFRRDFPRGIRGMVRWGEFPDDDDLRGKRARAGTAQPGAPPLLRSLLPLCDRVRATRMEPSFSQVIGRMNRDRPAHVYARLRAATPLTYACTSVTAAITELRSYKVTEL